MDLRNLSEQIIQKKREMERMSALWLLTEKNLKNLIRAKGSALIVIFAPLLIILILGLSFNTTSKYGLNIGIYAPTETAEVTKLIDGLKEQEFTVAKYENIDKCVEDIKRAVMHTCLDLPSSLKVESNKQIEIKYYVDQSKINLVWMVQQTLAQKFTVQEQQLSESLSKDILTRLSETQTKLNTEKTKIASTKQKNSDAVKSTEGVKADLATIDFTTPTTTYNAAVVDVFKTEIATRLSNTSQAIVETKATLAKINTTSAEKKKVEILLTKVDEAVSVASAFLDSGGPGSLQEVSALIAVLQSDVDATKIKLTAAAEKVKTNNENLDGVKLTIGESIALLEGTQAVLEQIHTNLQSQKVTDAAVVAQPLVMKIETVSAEKTYLSYLFPVLLTLVIMFSSLLLGTSLVMMEKNSPAFFRNFFLPIRKITFILSIYLTNVILILIQVIIILGLALIFIPNILELLPMLGLVLFLAASIFTFLGMVIGYVYTSEETGVLASISLGSLLLFISGTILPIEGTSITVRNIISFSPFVIVERLIREVMIFNAGFELLWIDLLLLLGYTLVLFLVILAAESVLHKHLLERFLNHHHKIHRQNQKMGKI